MRLTSDVLRYLFEKFLVDELGGKIETIDRRCVYIWSPQEILSHTCLRFREIVVGIQSAWTHINVGWWIDPDLLNRWLGRAKNSALRLVFPPSHSDDQHAIKLRVRILTSRVLQCHRSIRAIYIKRDHAADVAHLVGMFISVSLPSLEVLEIICSDLYFEVPVYWVPLHRRFAPRISRLVLSHFLVVPPPSTAYERLKILALRLPPERADLTFIDLCNVVSSSPVLSSLTLDLADHSGIPGLTSAPWPTGEVVLRSYSVSEFSIFFGSMSDAQAFMGVCYLPSLIRFGIALAEESDLDDLSACLSNIPCRSLLHLHVVGFDSCSRTHSTHVLAD